MQAQASNSLQGAVASDGRHRSIIDGTGDRIEDDVENHQQDDPSEPDPLFLLTVHGNTPFSCAGRISFDQVNPSRIYPLNPK
jgi:hypothetical protein